VYLTKSLSDGKDGKPYDNSDSVVDSDEVAEPPKKPTPKWVYVVIIGIAVGLGASGFILGLDFSDDSLMITEQEQKIKCDEWLELADSLVRTNNNNKNVTEWSAKDRIRVLKIEELYQDNCIPTKQKIIGDLEKCTIIYITIESLIDKMEERQLDSLSQAEQKAYKANYKDYFDSYCNKIKDEIEQTDKFQNFNKTRGQ